MESSVELALQNKLVDFPCAFNLSFAKKVTTNKLRTVCHNLVSEIEINDDSLSELIMKKNLLTWVHFQLDRDDDAVELSNEVIKLTQQNNISSLANRCFVMWYKKGDELEAKQCFKILNILKLETNFAELLIAAKAEHAYYYSRIGGSDNLYQSIELFSEATSEKPDNYMWKYSLGLACRRATHGNIFCSSAERVNVEELKIKAIKNLFEVTEKGDHRLQSMAYAQLVKLRQIYPPRLCPNYNAMFCNLNLNQLCSKALEHGQELPPVLTACGKAMMSSDIDESIKLLQKSVSIKETSEAYHYLGKSYRRKAVMNLNSQSGDKSGIETQRLVHPNRREPSYSHEVGQVGDQSTSEICREGRHSEVDTVCKTRYQLTRSVSFEHIDFDYKRHPDTLPSTLVTDRRKMYNYQHEQNPPRLRDQWKHDETFYNLNRDHRTQKINIFSRSKSSEYAVQHGTTPPTHQSYKRSYSTYNQRGRGFATHDNERRRTKDELVFCIRKPKYSMSLNKDDELVKKAIESLKKAIEIAKENVPAVLDLGIILKESGQIHEALKQFNKVTNSPISSHNSRITLISAYEQSGLCYLDLSKLDPSNINYEADGKNKLTKAVMYAADLISVMPDLKGDDVQDLWTAFRTLESDIDKDTDFQTRQRKKIKLLELAGKYGSILEVVKKLREYTEDELDREDIIKVTLESYIKQGQPENGLAFQNIVATRPAVKHSIWWKNDPVQSLTVKVLLLAIEKRLQEANENTTRLFQQIFQIIFGSCFDTHESEKNVNSSAHDGGDVLVVFDEDQDSEECPGVNRKYVQYLMKVINLLFGLEVEVNLKGSDVYGNCFTDEIQLQEMKRYSVVIIILGDEPRDNVFNEMLKRVPHNKPNEKIQNQIILVVNTGLKDVPTCLKHYECLNLEDIGVLGDICQDRDPNISFSDILNQGSHRDVDNIMKLFCCMIGRKWPCA